MWAHNTDQSKRTLMTFNCKCMKIKAQYTKNQQSNLKDLKVYVEVVLGP
jgi:hypothetical protein